jgi:hypothetical protein
MKPTIKLDKEQIANEIKMSDNCDGCRVMAVAPDGSAYRVHWMARNRQRNPWPDGWLIIGIPALFADGSGEENELAEECIKDNGLNIRDVEDEIEKGAEYDGLVDYTGAKFPDWMQAARENALDFLLDAFLAACNGYGEDLNTDAPWGYRGDVMMGDMEEIEPPAEFEWDYR